MKSRIFLITLIITILSCNNQDKKNDSKPQIKSKTITKKYITGSDTLIMYYLNNLFPEKFKHKEHFDHTTKGEKIHDLSHMTTEELIKAQPKLEGKVVYTVDCIAIANETIGRPIPNTPMLGAFMKISGMYDIEFFKENMKRVLGKLPQKIIDANMLAIQRAYDEVN